MLQHWEHRSSVDGIAFLGNFTWELIFFDTSLDSSPTVGLLHQAWAWSEASLHNFWIGYELF